MLELATLGKAFGKLPSELWGLLDRDLALDFDLLHNLRLTLFEAEKAKREAEAWAGEQPNYSAFPQNQIPDLNQLN